MSLALLNEQYRARFGQDICLTDGYRSYAAQVSVRNRKPGLAARPGTSEHGFGLAVDLCGGVESQGEGYWWLRENAGAFGYENPAGPSAAAAARSSPGTGSTSPVSGDRRGPPSRPRTTTEGEAAGLALAGAPGRIRTCAPASGGQCSIP